MLTLAVTSGSAGRGAFLAFVYGLGIGIPFLVAALAFQRGMRAFSFARRHAALVTRVGGGDAGDRRQLALQNPGRVSSRRPCRTGLGALRRARRRWYAGSSCGR